jgi:hypothetical protein
MKELSSEIENTETYQAVYLMEYVNANQPPPILLLHCGANHGRCLFAFEVNPVRYKPLSE